MRPYNRGPAQHTQQIARFRIALLPHPFRQPSTLSNAPRVEGGLVDRDWTQNSMITKTKMGIHVTADMVTS